MFIEMCMYNIIVFVRNGVILIYKIINVMGIWWFVNFVVEIILGLYLI